MELNAFGDHECGVVNQPTAQEWTCPDCRQIWLGSVEMHGGFLWETPVNRELRLLAEQEQAERRNSPPPEQFEMTRE